MTIKNLIEKYEKSIEGLEEGMSLFDDEGGAVYASFAREIEIYETVIADLQDLTQKQGDLISRGALKELEPHYSEDGYRMFYEYEIDNVPTVCGNNPKWCESCVSKGKCASTRPQGEWEPKPVTFGTCFLQGFECECGRIVMQRENFCPDCGAQMVGGET